MQLPPLEPNYVDPVTRGWEHRIIIILVFPLVLVIVGIRIFTRLRISRSFGVDDWLIIAAPVCFLSISCSFALEIVVRMKC
ncbi:hypothetical protein HYALB_00002825 [Hymenoscyphus albidus]|uniref:Uncharacterized protein n=1 Tax=Hymenoscyphus albidus TaxID=595503 RepID=A0A9N9PZ51_9HELO|nr:hypothetical protein HYALB_00002825 [Hymenoscyphus albidus]